MPRYYVTLHVVGSGAIIVEGESETAVRAAVEAGIRDATLAVGALEYEEIDVQSIVEVPVKERLS